MMTPEERARKVQGELIMPVVDRKRIAAAIREAQREQMERDAEIIGRAACEGTCLHTDCEIKKAKAREIRRAFKENK